MGYRYGYVRPSSKNFHELIAVLKALNVIVAPVMALQAVPFDNIKSVLSDEG